MNAFKLTAKERQELELRHKKCKYSKESYRINVVLLRDKGWSIPMIAQALLIHESTVTRHLNDYLEGKLTIESGGSSSFLSELQTAELISHLEEHTYHCTLGIIAHIKSQYGVIYSIPGLNKWLHRNGFSYKKPKGHPHKASQAKQAEFIMSYDELKQTIEPDDGIMFLDACHPSMATKLSYGWIKKGATKAIETTASRTRINLVGALDLEQLSSPIAASYDTVDGDSIVDFLQLIRNHSNISGTIHLVVDGASYNNTPEVIEKSKELNIKLFHLPPYSPNLNPIERLWQVMNEHARNNKFFNTPTEFRQGIKNFFQKTLPQIASDLQSRINDNFQKLNHAF